MSNSKAKICSFKDTLPPAIYWDASFIVNFTFDKASYFNKCGEYYYRLKEKQIHSYISTLTLDETWYILLKVKIEEDYAPDKFWKVYNRNKSIVSPYIPLLKELTDRLRNQLWVEMTTAPVTTIDRVLERMQDSYLLPRDAFHLEIMQSLGVDSIVTLDEDFASIPNITVYTCKETILRK